VKPQPRTIWRAVGKISFCSALAWGFVVLILTANLLAAGQAVSKDDLRQIGERAKSLQNVVIRTQREVNLYPPQGTVSVIRGKYGSVQDFSFLNGKAIYDSHLTADATRQELAKGLGTAELLQDTRYYESDRVESLSRRVGQEQDHGVVQKHMDFPSIATIDLALGVRRLHPEGWIAPDFFSKLPLHRDTDGLIRGEETVPGGGKNEWTWDPSKGYALVRVRFLMDDHCVDDIQCNDFRPAGPVLIPYHVMRQNFAPRTGEWKVSRTIEVTVLEAQVNDPKNIATRYQLPWPPKTLVLDDRIGFSFITDKPDPSPVTDDEIHQKAAAALGTLLK